MAVIGSKYKYWKARVSLIIVREPPFRSIVQRFFTSKLESIVFVFVKLICMLVESIRAGNLLEFMQNKGSSFDTETITDKMITVC